MHDYYTIWKVRIQLYTNGSLHSSGFISGANKRSNGQLRVFQILSRGFDHHYIGIIRGALIQYQVGYEATTIGWSQMQD